MMFRKEPFFYGHDNYDQLVKIAKVRPLMLACSSLFACCHLHPPPMESQASVMMEFLNFPINPEEHHLPDAFLGLLDADMASARNQPYRLPELLSLNPGFHNALVPFTPLHPTLPCGLAPCIPPTIFPVPLILPARAVPQHGCTALVLRKEQATTVRHCRHSNSQRSREA